MGFRRAVLVRHGESRWNAERRWQGHGGVGLTDAGRAQAERTADYLARVERGVVGIVTSDLDRVLETAEPTRRRFAVPTTVTTAWREIDVGWWSGLTWEDIAQRDPDGYAAVVRGADEPRGGGERPSELRARVRAAMNDLVGAHPAGTVIVVTHGGCVRAAAAEALGLPDAFPLHGVGNASVTVLAEHDGHWRLESYNATGHLAVGE